MALECRRREKQRAPEKRKEAVVNTFPRREIFLNFMILTPRDSLLLFNIKNGIMIFPY